MRGKNIIASLLGLSLLIQVNLPQSTYAYVDESGPYDMLEDYNPNARVLLGGYRRNGTFIVGNIETKEVKTATQVRADWKYVNGKSTLVTSYQLQDGSVIDKTENIIGQEIMPVTGTYTLKRACRIYTCPVIDEAFITPNSLPAGNYKATYQALGVVKLEDKNGQSYWVSPQYDHETKYLAPNYGDFDGGLSKLSLSSIHSVPIKQLLMPIQEDKRVGASMKPTYVTIHNTGTTVAGSTAKRLAENQISDGRTFTSWHFTVDNKEIYQSIPMDESAWHAGDGENMGNATTIGIEICENRDGNYAQAEKNAAYLTAQILYENGLPANAVKRHYDWSGKNCPHNLIEKTNGSMGWDAFLTFVETEYNRIKQNDLEDTITPTIPASFQLIKDGLKENYQEGYILNQPLHSTYQQFQDKLQSYDPSVSIVVTKNNQVVPLTNKIATGQLITVKKGTDSFTCMMVVNGDVNGDGTIGSIDFLMIKDSIMEEITLTKHESLAANVDHSSDIGSIDFLMIKEYIMGEIDSL